MCEVLAISVNEPVGVFFSWAGFQRRGASNPDGWGYAYSDGNQLIRERYPRSLSQYDDEARLAGEVESPVFLAHVRLKVQGEKSEKNAQPFLAADQGIAGGLTVSRGCRMTSRYKSTFGHLQEGTTGAELLFWRLVTGAAEHGGLVSGLCHVLPDVFDPGVLEDHAQSSFALTDGTTMAVFRHEKPLHAVTRQPPHDRVCLRDPDLDPYQVDLRLEKSPAETATVFATKPLTRGEEWHPVPDRTLVVVRDGLIVENYRIDD